VARVVVTPAALDDFDRLIRVIGLPPSTRRRVGSSLEALGDFPLLGAPLAGRWSGYRFVLGPWRWMIFVYVYDDAGDRVSVVAIHDARSSRAATRQRD
jgi:plasmid stabilization system protein ParE